MPRSAIAVGLAVVGAVAAASDRPDTASLTLLHTSDLHGQVLPVDDRSGRVHPGSLARVATLVARVRSSAPGPVLVLDSGDALQGSLLERYGHVEWGLASPTVAAMNRIGYDAMAVGNHEFNFGLEVLARARRQASFPFLSANVVDADTGEPAFEPYRVVEAGGVRIGVLGLTTPGVPLWERPEHYAGLRFEAMDRAAAEWVPRLRAGERCDLVVVLAHTGFEDDADPAGDRENQAGRLTRVAGIDVLLTGHTHRDLEPVEREGVLVSQPASGGRTVTRLDLRLERRAAGWRIADWSGANLPAADEPPDPAVVALAAPLASRVDEVLDAPVGHAVAPVSIAGCRVADCAAVDLVHSVQRDASGAQLSLASLLSLGTPELPAGPVPRRWIHALYVYPNTLVAVRVTGAELRDVLEHAARVYDGYRCDDRRCEVVVDPAIAHYNGDSVAGVSYRIDPTRPEGRRVLDLRYEGRPVDPVAEFTLACNSYRATGGGDYPHLADAERVWSSSDSVAELIEGWIGRRSPWTPEVDANWWIGPDLVAVPEGGAGATP